MQFSISCDSCVQQMNNSLQIRDVYNYHCYIKQLQYRAKRWHDMWPNLGKWFQIWETWLSNPRWNLLREQEVREEYPSLLREWDLCPLRGLLDLVLLWERWRLTRLLKWRDDFLLFLDFFHLITLISSYSDWNCPDSFCSVVLTQTLLKTDHAFLGCDTCLS